MSKKLRITLLFAVGTLAAVFVWALTVPPNERVLDRSPTSLNRVAWWIDDVAESVGLRVNRRSCANTECYANLKQIDGAKATWALENKMGTNDIPSASELYGATNYIRDVSICPQGGVYRIGRVNQKPSCTFSGHSLWRPALTGLRDPA